MILTAKTIESARPGDTLSDATVPGLQLRIFPKRRTFYLYFRTKAKTERRPKLGDYPLINLSEARELARAMLRKVAAGEDPVQDRIDAANAPTVNDLCDRYMKDHAARKKSKDEDQRMIDRHVRPKLGKRRVADIQYEDVVELHVAMRATPYLANRLKALLSKMFNLAERWRMRPTFTNPCRHVERYREASRRRKMTVAEAAAIARALVKYETSRPASVAFIRLLILTGARKSEIASARSEWIEGSTLNLPDSKTGAKSVFLSPQALKVLESLPKVKDQTITGIACPQALWRLVRVEAGCPDLRLHDLRRSFASTALSLGFSLSQVGELLGHASAQTTKGYAYLMPEPAQLATEAIATRLEEMMSS